MAESADPRTRFRDLIDKEEVNLPSLPFIHITDGYNLEEILKPKKLKATVCSVFSREILYMFYGKPAYRAKHSGSNFLSCNLPCVFIFDPEKIKDKIRDVYPFDTGAFFAGYYSSFFHKKTDVQDFATDPILSSAQKIVQTFFRSNREYFEGASRKNVDLPPMNFEAEGYIELSRAPSHPEANSKLRADERASAIELHFHEDIDLTDALIACILPAAFLDVKSVSEAISKTNPKIIKTYSSIHKLTYEGLAGKIYEIVEDIYKERGYL